MLIGFLYGSAGKESAAMQETWVRSLGWENPLEKGKELQYSGLENSMGCIVHGVAKSRTRLSDFHSHPWVSMTNKRLLELEARQQRRSPAIGHHSVAEH